MKVINKIKIINPKNNFYLRAQKDNRETLGYYPEKIDFIIKEAGRRKIILDVGCNDGCIGHKLIKNKNQVFGIDIAKDKLLLSRKRGLEVKEIDIETEKLPYKNNFFDVIILGDILEHVFDTDRLLEEVKRVLKKGGKLIITTPNVASLGRRLMLLFGLSPFLEHSVREKTAGLPAVGHIRYYTVSVLKSQLKILGFRKIHIEGNTINFYFFESKWLAKIKSSLAMMLFVKAVK